jgi:hypothetical protein
MGCKSAWPADGERVSSPEKAATQDWDAFDIMIVFFAFLFGVVVGFTLNKVREHYQRRNDTETDVIYISNHEGECYHYGYTCLRNSVSKLEHIETKRRCKKCVKSNFLHNTDIVLPVTIKYNRNRRRRTDEAEIAELFTGRADPEFDGE